MSTRDMIFLFFQCQISGSGPIVCTWKYEILKCSLHHFMVQISTSLQNVSRNGDTGTRRNKVTNKRWVIYYYIGDFIYVKIKITRIKLCVGAGGVISTSPSLFDFSKWKASSLPFSNLKARNLKMIFLSPDHTHDLLIRT